MFREIRDKSYKNFQYQIGLQNSSFRFINEISKSSVQVRKAEPGEFARVGQLLVQVYSQLEGFPKPSEQPGYYNQ